jgi:hypothetical protein
MAHYGRFLSAAPTAKAWGKIEGARVHFFTVVDMSSPSDEEAVYAAERELIDIVGPEHVLFDVYPDEQSLESDPSMVRIDRLPVA